MVEELQRIYLNTMNRELERTPITFPVTAACFSVDEDRNIQDEDFLDLIAHKDQKFRFINIYSGRSSTLSSCCRLRSDRNNEYFNSFGAGSTKIGSLGVVSINFPRLAILYKDNRELFFEKLRDLVDVCAKINHAKRRIVKKRIDNGNLPLYTHGFMELGKQYSTVGINGLNECLEISGYDILTEEGQQFALDIIETINEMNAKFEKQYGAAHNCEQVPLAA
jgi:ribonucleoside-triphosphate reductase